jgi:prephenate dehydrogenase
MRIAILGLGLIGGSIARALRALPPTERPSVAAFSPSAAASVGGAVAAADEGVVDEATGDARRAVAGADLVVLAMPASSVPEWLAALADPAGLGGELSGNATITDVASTKARILGQADALGLRFVGGHPMAGREASGYGASAGDLFVDRPWVVVPGAAAALDDVARVEWLARACRAVPVRMDAASHDAAAAAISHLPLVVSAALVEAVVGAGDGPDRPGWPAAAALASSGWQGMTRLARGDPAMGAGILATNPGPVTRHLRAIRAVLDDWIAALERDGGPDEALLRERLERARRRVGGEDPRS